MSALGEIIQAIGWAFLPLVFLPVLVLVSRGTDNIATPVSDIIDITNLCIGEMAKWLLPILVLSVVFTVFALSIFGWASPQLDESAVYLHAFALMLGMGSALLANEHVRVDVLYSRFSETGKSLVDFAGFYALLLPLMLAILWESQSSTAFSWAILEGSPDADGIRGVFLLKTLIPLFALLMLTQGLAIAIRAARKLRDS